MMTWISIPQACKCQQIPKTEQPNVVMKNFLSMMNNLKTLSMQLGSVDHHLNPCGGPWLLVQLDPYHVVCSGVVVPEQGNVG
jgi:hypothetical protein